jgi:hypothetical protein
MVRPPSEEHCNGKDQLLSSQLRGTAMAYYRLIADKMRLKQQIALSFEKA